MPPSIYMECIQGGISMEDTLSVNQITVNGLVLDYRKYSYEERDLLIGILDRYLLRKDNNESIFKTFKRITQTLHLPLNLRSEIFTNHINNDVFKEWYANLLARICKKSIKNYEIKKLKYIWNGNKLTPIDTPVQIMIYEFK